MNLYDTEEIRRSADCLELMRTVFKANERQKGRFDCPWRSGSDSGAVAVEKDKWYDHVAKEGGDAISLVCKGMDKNFIEANEWLGRHCRLTPKTVAREQRRTVAEYVYHDQDGIPLHRKLRYQPKSFSQEHWTAEGWKPGLMKGVDPVLYRLPDVIRAVAEGRWILLAEGEKDADNLGRLGFCTTTQTNGAGSWMDGYTETLKGGNVCIIADKDEPGRAHAAMVAKALTGKARTVKVVELPGEQVKDASDWIEAGGTVEQLKEIIQSADNFREIRERTKELAKECNRQAFCNFYWEDAATSSGSLQKVRRPKLINQLCEEVLDRFMGFPRRIAGDLFDHDRKTGKIRIFSDSTALFAWIQEKSNQPVNWARIEGAVTQEQLFIALKENVRAYEMITPVPTWPMRDDVYYTYGRLPEPDGEHRHLETFLDFFNPADAHNSILLRAMVASPLYYKVKVDRPLWVIDSDTAQGSGKTKLAEAVARLYGSDEGDEGEPFWVDVKSIINEQSADRVWRRLLSSTGRRKRVVLIDNVTGFLAAPSLATLVTQGSISGLAPYGRGEETRPNDLTYIITSNSARFDRDLIARSIFVKVNRPDKPDPNWAERLFAYIRQYRLNILAEIIDTMDKGGYGNIETKTRFRAWERDVMAPMAGNEDARIEAIASNEELQARSDTDRERAEELRKYIKAKVERQYGQDARAFIPNPLLKKWFVEALPDEDRIPRNMIPQVIENWAKSGFIDELNVKIYRNQNGVRGFAWNVDLINYGDWRGIPVCQDTG